MKRLTLLFVASFLLFAALACSGGESEQISSDLPATVAERISSDPRTILEQTRSAIAALDSYHVAFSLSTHPDDVQGEYRWEVWFAAPDNYRMLMFGAVGESETVCEYYTSPDGRSRSGSCREVLTSITGSILAEWIYVGDTLYIRQCEDIETACGPWREQPRGPYVIAGPSASLTPGWPLVALELAGELELVGQEEIDGVALIHIRGSVNHLRAILENARRTLAAEGITSFGTECMTVETTVMMNETGELVESAPDTPVENEETCRELTFEESQEQGLNFYDDNLAVIDIWVSLDDLFLRRITLVAPPKQPVGFDVSYVMEYSLFDQVQIEAPR